MLPHIVEQVSDTTSDEFMATFSGFNEPVLCYFGRYINVQTNMERSQTDTEGHQESYRKNKGRSQMPKNLKVQ